MKDQKTPAGNRWSAGHSGNPNGRPRGRPNREEALRRELHRYGRAVLPGLFDAAMAGDLGAAKLLLERGIGVAKPRSDLVRFELNVNASLADQAKQIMQAVSLGKVDPVTGKLLVETLGETARIVELSELERRLSLLEEEHGHAFTPAQAA